MVTTNRQKYWKEYHIQHKEQINAYHKQHYQKNKVRIHQRRKELDAQKSIPRWKREYEKYKEKHKMRMKRYYEKYPEKRKLGLRLYRQKQKAKLLEYNRQWRKNNPEKYREQWRRSALNRPYHPLDPKLETMKDAIKIRDNNTCQWYGCGLTNREVTICVHHIFPRSEYPELIYNQQYMICYCGYHHGLWHQYRGDNYYKFILNNPKYRSVKVFA